MNLTISLKYKMLVFDYCGGLGLEALAVKENNASLRYFGRNFYNA